LEKSLGRTSGSSKLAIPLISTLVPRLAQQAHLAPPLHTMVASQSLSPCPCTTLLPTSQLCSRSAVSWPQHQPRFCSDVVSNLKSCRKATLTAQSNAQLDSKGKMYRTSIQLALLKFAQYRNDSEKLTGLDCRFRCVFNYSLCLKIQN